MKSLINLFLSGAGVFLTAYLLPGVHVSDYVTALIVAVVLGVVNLFIKPILVILAFPITLLTLGLFSIVINAILIFGVAYFVDGFAIDSFWWAIGAGVVLGLITSFLHSLNK